MQFFKRESCFYASRDYQFFPCFSLKKAFLQANFLNFIMNKIGLCICLTIFSIFRKLWIHQTGWTVFPLTYRTWAKSLFHFLMDTIAALPTKICFIYHDVTFLWNDRFLNLIKKLSVLYISLWLLFKIFDQKVFETNLNFTYQQLKNLKK